MIDFCLALIKLLSLIFKQFKHNNISIQKSNLSMIWDEYYNNNVLINYIKKM